MEKSTVLLISDYDLSGVFYEGLELQRSGVWKDLFVYTYGHAGAITTQSLLTL